MRPSTGTPTLHACRRLSLDRRKRPEAAKQPPPWRRFSPVSPCLAGVSPTRTSSNRRAVDDRRGQTTSGVGAASSAAASCRCAQHASNPFTRLRGCPTCHASSASSPSPRSPQATAAAAPGMAGAVPIGIGVGSGSTTLNPHSVAGQRAVTSMRAPLDRFGLLHVHISTPATMSVVPPDRARRDSSSPMQRPTSARWRGSLCSARPPRSLSADAPPGAVAGPDGLSSSA